VPVTVLAVNLELPLVLAILNFPLISNRPLLFGSSFFVMLPLSVPLNMAALLVSLLVSFLSTVRLFFPILVAAFTRLSVLQDEACRMIKKINGIVVKRCF